ncbi:hypothetical protein [Senegalia massiliensis]|uniref:Chloramphenicol resistance protein n=1 Tax=Senegalia massiliensis TaxID=1720316 RepID=A0A845R3Q1_9CLOT|nr:hypothetical protein [Senegalia massiliensis]NBI08062.1 hypothetical protein [Senegalia massiliensis]
MIIDKIRDFISVCPLLDEFAKLNVDFLGPNATEYTIDSIPTDSILKQYVDGGKLKQYVFVFGSREFYGPDVLQNIENSGFYEKFSEWLDTKTELGELPLLEGNKESDSIEAMSSGYLFGSTEDTARYQIQCRLIYYEDK